MKLTKRILSLVMAVLMLCTGMAVTASAADLYTLNSSNCYVDKAEGVIFVKKASVTVEGETYDLIFTATQKSDATKTLKGYKDDNGNTAFLNPTTGETYVVKGTYTANGVSNDATNAFAVTMLKSQNAPAAPVPKKITTTSIEINAVSGCEYRLKGSEAFVKTTTFTGLTPATSYTIEMRYAETATHYASPVSTLTVKTLATPDKNAPVLPEIKEFLVDKTNKSITVKEIDGVEFSIDNGANWQVSGHFANLKADETYAIIARYKFDASVQAPNPASDPVEIRTNVRESYPADIKNCKFSASEGNNYANEAISIAVTADTPAKFHDTQFGDTKYIPAYFTIDNDTTPLTFTSSDGKVFKASFIPGEAKANKKVAVNVYYNKMKCVGEKENGEANWVVDGKEESKTYYVQVGENYTFFTEIRNFFLNIFNILFNDLPAKINDLIKDIDINSIMGGFNEILKMFGDISGGGITGGGSSDIGGLLGGLTQ